MTTETPRPAAAAEADVTLDPHDWEAFRALAHRMVDDSLDQLTTLRDWPPWTPPPAEVAAALSGEPLPRSLAASGWLSSRIVPSYSGPPRRYYRITDEGRAVLAEWRAVWRDTRNFVDQFTGPSS